MGNINAKAIARLACGYELMFSTLCHIAGTSGGSPHWFTHKGQEVTARVDPLWKLNEDSNAHKPGDCLSQYQRFADWAADAEKKASALEHWRQEVGKLHSQVATKDAEIAKLRASLEPFARVAKYDIGHDEDNQELFRPMLERNRAPRLTVGDLRAAFNAHGDDEDAL